MFTRKTLAAVRQGTRKWLEEAGIREIFLPGTPISEIIDWTKEHCSPARQT